MDTNAIFKNARKVYLTENIEENTEECPDCRRSSGIRSMLCFFYVNFYEAIYKCSKCMYPFGNYKFKNVRDNTLYMYVPKVDDASTVADTAADTIDDPSNLWHDVTQPNDNTAFLAKTFTPSQTNADIEEFDFDLGFLDSVSNDDLPLQATVTSLNDNTCGQPDDDGIDDFLNDLIHGNSGNGFPETMATAAQTEDNNQLSMSQFDLVEPRVQLPSLPLSLPSSSLPSLLPSNENERTSALLPPPPPPPPPAAVQMTKAKPKLTKCLKTIAMKVEKKEKKGKRTKNPVAAKKPRGKKIEEKAPVVEIGELGDTSKLDEITKVYSRSYVSTKKLPSFGLAATNGSDVDRKLISLVQLQDSHRPLDLLQQLKNLDTSKVNAPLIRRIITKSNATQATPPKIEQKETVSSESDVFEPVKAEPTTTLITSSVCTNQSDAVQWLSNQFGTYGCIERPPNGLPDLSSIYGYDSFCNISYANTNAETFGQPLELDQINEDEVEIIPIEVGEDGSFDIETETVSNASELDLFGCSSLSAELEVPVSPAPLDVTTEAALVVAESETLTKTKKPRKKKETVTSVKPSNESHPTDAVAQAPKAKVKRPRKKKLETSENCDGNVDANLNVNSVETAAATVTVPKPPRKPRKTKPAVSAEASGQNLAGFSLNELQESAANAAIKAVKPPRKRSVKIVPKPSVVAPSTKAASNDIEIAPETTARSVPMKKLPKKKPSFDEVITEVENVLVTQFVARKKAPKRTVKQPRRSKAEIANALNESVATAPIVDAIAPVAPVAKVKPVAAKARKKKIVATTPAMSDVDMQPKKPPRKPRKRKIAESADDGVTMSPMPANKKARKTETVAAAEIAREVSTAATIASNADDTKSI